MGASNALPGMAAAATQNGQWLSGALRTRKKCIAKKMTRAAHGTHA
jgi:hypothetical protein